MGGLTSRGGGTRGGGPGKDLAESQDTRREKKKVGKRTDELRGGGGRGGGRGGCENPLGSTKVQSHRTSGRNIKKKRTLGLEK